MASASISTAVVLLSILLLSVSSSALPSETILDAAEILNDSGYVSMSLTLEALSQTSLIPNSSSLTIFAPADLAFSRSGQPSLSLLQFHFSPFSLPFQTLISLPSGTKIPTIFSSHSLIVTTTTSDSQVSLNNLKITSTPIFDDGLLIIYGINNFFDPDFETLTPSNILGSCGSTPNDTMVVAFRKASEILKSDGYSVMAQFLDVQVEPSTIMTVFAPVDEALVNKMSDFTRYPSIFLRHVVPCRLLWNDLVKLDDGTVLPTYLKGFSIEMTRSGSVLLLNEVPVFFPNMYISDTLVIHGLLDILLSRSHST